MTQGPLRVLIAACVPSRREGGVAAVAQQLGGELEKRGHEVTYLFQDELFQPDEKIPHRFIELVFAWRVNQYIRKNRERIGVANLHAPAGLIYGLRRKFLGGGGPAYVMTLHGLEERRMRVQAREEKKGFAWHYALRNRIWQRLYRLPLFAWSIRTADGAHTVARDTWNYLQLRYGMAPERTEYISSGVDERFFIEREYSADRPLRLLYAGTWLDQRGIFYLREALARLAKELPGMTMTFAGCGCPAETITEFFGPELAGTVRVQQVVPAGEMQGLLAEHDVFLFPSLMEGMPVVVLEAMATGMPVITTETCGMPDVVEDDFNGVLVPPANTDAIVASVRRLAGSAETRRRLGEAARETMRRHTWKAAGEKLEALFRRVIALEKKGEG